MKKIIFISAILFLGVSSVFAQNIAFEKGNFKQNKDGYKAAIDNLKRGDSFYDEGEFYMKDAIPFYEAAQMFNPNNADLNYKLGVCYFFSHLNQKAILRLNKAMELNANVASDVNYYLGKSYQRNYEWDNAIIAYQAFKLALNNEQTEELKLANKFIQECKTGIELTSNPVRVWVDNLGTNINTQYHEYGIAINADASTMMFTSRRPGNMGGLIDPITNDYFEDIYMSEKNNGVWSPAQNLGPPVNDESHNACLSLSNDGMELFVFKGNERTLGDIYKTNRYTGTWSKPKELGKNINTKYHESSASLSPDRRKLYFVSENPDGYGGRDIYVSVWDPKKKEFGSATNIGPVINTEYDEEGVFIHPDGKTLYFSSEGHNTMGDFDIFVSTWDGSNWATPVNIGYPINSPDVDVFFLVSANKRFGFFTSEKEGGYGLRDIYQIEFLGEVKEPVLNSEDLLIASIAQPKSSLIIEPTVDITTAKLALVRGIVLDEVSKKPLFANMELNDNQTGEILAEFQSNQTSGQFLISLPSGKNYGIAVKSEGYLFHSENFLIPEGSLYREYDLEIYMKKIEVGKKIILKNIFFESNSSVLSPNSKTEIARIAKIMNENPTLVIEISGHTDNIGDDNYNQKLSEKRAKSVVDALIKLGISSARLEYKGYGENDPVASNLNEEGRSENRRTEFKVLVK
jgi:outer membrane protein OmpA-like peptidoglycan-associated protein